MARLRTDSHLHAVLCPNIVSSKYMGKVKEVGVVAGWCCMFKDPPLRPHLKQTKHQRVAQTT